MENGKRFQGRELMVDTVFQICNVSIVAFRSIDCGISLREIALFRGAKCHELTV
jgi:hypothetical protein